MERQVLIVDDDTWLAEQVAGHLEQHADCRVIRAADGLEAMTCIDTQVPDAIILDVFMPGPNGIVLLHELQSHADLAAVPVILYTNNTDNLPEMRSQLASYGIRDVLDKGKVVPDDIVRSVRRVLA